MELKQQLAINKSGANIVVYPRIGKKVPNNYFNVSRILGKITLIFWKILAFFIDNLKTFRHYYTNTVIIRSFIYYIYQ
jgi:hypothetical protein